MRRMKVVDTRFDNRFRMLAIAALLGLSACNTWQEQAEPETRADSASSPVAGVLKPAPVETLEQPVAAAVEPPVINKPVDSIAPQAPQVQQVPQVSIQIKPAPAAKPLPVAAKVETVTPVDTTPPKTPVAAPAPITTPVTTPKPVPAIKPAPVPVAAATTVPSVEKQLIAKPLVGSVQGSVVILGKNSEKLPSQEVIINLEPLFDVPAAIMQPRSYSIDMKDKRYTPAVMSIRAGDKVNFHNRDGIKHNVFSSSGNNAFDLGTYGLGVTQGVNLKNPGIVKVYCNIHAEMAAFISINTKGYSAITQADGRFSFKDVPVGEYMLNVWHVRGETRKRLSVAVGKVSQNNITLDTTTFELIPHLNKFGKSYQINPTLFKDEFY
jgi:plastocyanin